MSVVGHEGLDELVLTDKLLGKTRSGGAGMRFDMRGWRGVMVGWRYVVGWGVT
eukprot:CAMPEP_0184361804 /NCGR_PEP_ID=MMETSP1089-20130417/132004_1 /TAXON_ID=38269 ORGANISM="Gloeochaete wittrockiana, Strain SAG46.84" /NCGR_SAMPLE_ID=MMETSP1089 /ASSEMBLY_ACC=CAM_ASM_000445 /LENGTH=52 /DNA_ID=CAMNT_0026701619 /DNA_START=32 /DNA_END=187 /DNA_ORIENTATION=+